MNRRFFPRPVASGALALLSLLLLAPVRWAWAAPRQDTTQPYRSLDVFSEVLAYVENNYVEDVQEKELVYGAIEGLLQKLDPHSAFLRPEAYRMMKDETSGEFDGLGLEVVLQGDDVVVVAPVADSPAERAGLQPGDRIVKVDGASVRDLPLYEVVRRMKGPAGTKVVLEVMRVGFREPQSLTVVRDRVRTSSVDWKVLDPAAGLVYVKVKVFQDRTDRQLKKALDDARQKLGREVQGLVLDLRNNPGGLLDQAVRVADRFLTSGVIVSTEGRGQRAPEVERAREKDTEPPYPVAVLVNRGSASASEIVAGALQDQGRAVIVGTQTFGKGSVQTIIELEDGSALKLTVAKYYTPKHRSIQELGITPDVVVADRATRSPSDEGPAERDLKRHLHNEQRDEAALEPAPDAKAPTAHPAPAPQPAGDVQLERAVEVLRGARAPRAPEAVAAPLPTRG
ncbi:MAG TPA: S41 family peptidase [Anaeromyxobacteraceae bacterium]|nr:S41 family peptidase [Anaeromyxobacteraceae bacterium]